jgi:hypothetical protein
MATKLSPVPYNVPIVDDKGNPTPYFQRLLEILLAEKAVTDGLAAAAVQSDRAINTGTGLTGGGDLSADRTLSLDAVIDDLNDVDTTTTPPTDAQALIWDDANSLWIPGDVASGGGGGSAPWELIYSNTSITNPTGSIEIDVTGFGDVVVMGRNITLASSGYRIIHLSTNGGVSFYNTNGDYATPTTAGVEGGTFGVLNHGTTTTAARSFGGLLTGLNVSGAPKTAHASLDSPIRYFIADNANPVNRIRIVGQATSAGSLINMTGGQLFVIGKRAQPVGGPGWTELDFYDATASGAIASREVDVSGYNEVQVLLSGVTLAASGWRVIHFSDDAGSTYYNTTGDYININENGVTSTDSQIYVHSLTSSAARSGNVTIHNLQNGRGLVGVSSPNRQSASHQFIASNLAINKIKILGSTSSGTAIVTNMTGGKILVLGR